MKTNDACSAPIERVVRPVAGVVLDSGGWPVLTGRGNEDVFIKHRAGQRVYSKDALDSAVAEERERIALEFDRRAAPGVGFYEPHEPAAIIRALGPNVE